MLALLTAEVAEGGIKDLHVASFLFSLVEQIRKGTWPKIFTPLRLWLNLNRTIRKWTNARTQLHIAFVLKHAIISLINNRPQSHAFYIRSLLILSLFAATQKISYSCVLCSLIKLNAWFGAPTNQTSKAAWQLESLNIASDLFSPLHTSVSRLSWIAQSFKRKQHLTYDLLFMLRAPAGARFHEGFYVLLWFTATFSSRESHH